MNSSVCRARVAAAASAIVAVGALWLPVAAQGTIGAVDDPCVSATGTPTAGSAAVAGVEMGTPVAADGGATPETDPAAVDLDLLYLDLMVPRQAGIAAVARAAQTRVADPRLQEVAQSIADSHAAESGELVALRDRFYAGRDPLPVDTGTMAAMDRVAPGASIAMATSVVDTEVAGMLAAICDAEDPDRVFIDLAMSHHRASVELARAIVGAAAHAEIAAVAERIAADRQAGIDELAAIREDLYGSATPEPVAVGLPESRG